MAVRYLNLQFNNWSRKLIMVWFRELKPCRIYSVIDDCFRGHGWGLPLIFFQIRQSLKIIM